MAEYSVLFNIVWGIAIALFVLGWVWMAWANKTFKKMKEAKDVTEAHAISYESWRKIPRGKWNYLFAAGIILFIIAFFLAS